MYSFTLYTFTRFQYTSYAYSKMIQCNITNLIIFLRLGGSEKSRVVLVCCDRRLRTFTTDSASQLDVFGHDGDPLGVDGTQVGVLEETNQVGLAGFLQGHDGRALESKIGLEVLSDFTH